MAETAFERGETVVCDLDITDENGAAIDADTSVKITIYDPDDTAVVSAQDFTHDGTGDYHYSYSVSATADLGTYRRVDTAVHDGRTTIKRSEFRVRGAS